MAALVKLRIPSRLAASHSCLLLEQLLLILLVFRTSLCVGFALLSVEQVTSREHLQILPQ